MRRLFLLPFLLLPATAAEDDTMRTWTKLRELQAVKGPEAGLSAEQRTYTGERDTALQARFRGPVRSWLALLGAARLDGSRTRTGAEREEHLASGQLGLVCERRPHTWLHLGLETGHRGEPGAQAEAAASLFKGFALSAGLRSLAVRDNLASLAARHWKSSLDGSAYWDGPSPLFAGASLHADEHRLGRRDEGLRGEGWGGSVTSGLRFSVDRDVRFGWPFFDPPFLYESPRPLSAAVYATATHERFSAGDDFRGLVGLTRRSAAVLLGASAQVPVSRGIGLQADAEVGQDRERDIDFGGTLRYGAGLLASPRARTQFSLRAERQEEGAGIVRGRSTMFRLAMHINL